MSVAFCKYDKPCTFFPGQNFEKGHIINADNSCLFLAFLHFIVTIAFIFLDDSSVCTIWYYHLWTFDFMIVYTKQKLLCTLKEKVIFRVRIERLADHPCVAWELDSVFSLFTNSMCIQTNCCPPLFRTLP